MSDAIHPAPAGFANAASIGPDDYRRDYARALADPDAFWAEQAKRLDWSQFPTRIREVSFDAANLHIGWFADGVLNASVNCLDRHLQLRGDKTALLWEADDPATPPQHISYRQLHARVCQLANALRNLGVRKGDRVAIYLPMIPEAAVAMLACARIGAVHTVVFGGFSPDSLA
ncbi:MAG: AMP-binding protein, partial [Proteobacteria bacterium]|nr:AMP-binding protein [Pseudomonadota bacterium]